MNRKIDLAGLLRLLAVVEAGSFAEAARRLGVSRQAVHRSVEALERTAGGNLLDRAPGGLRPTPLGRTLVSHAAELKRLEYTVQAALERGRAEPSGSLRVTAPPLFTDTVLATAVAGFASKWPAVRVVVRVDSLRTDLIGDDQDLMIRVGAKPPDAHYAVDLGRTELLLCASPEYLATAGTPDSPDALAGRPVLQYGPRRLSRWVLSNGDEQRTVSPAPRLISDSAAVVIAACLAERGILYAPSLAVAPLLSDGSLVRVLPEWDLPGAKVWAIYGHRAQDDATLREFIQELRVANARHTDHAPRATSEVTNATTRRASRRSSKKRSAKARSKRTRR